MYPKHCTFTIYHDLEWQEYVVQVRVNGVVNDSMSYHTDDQDDARLTMLAMRKEYESQFTVLA